MKIDYLFTILAGAGILIGTTRLIQSATRNTAPPAGAPVAATVPPGAVERGRYLIRISGCNDCHTPRFMELGEKVPEREWLTGVPVGWRGPWGTSYASNLRRHLAAWPDAAAWMAMVKTREGLPPMPWPSLHAMSDDDLRAIHAYIRSLEVTGGVMPAPVPPDRTPDTPWLNLQPVMPPP
jgi:mono/diheme cytochrome c family protein